MEHAVLNGNGKLIALYPDYMGIQEALSEYDVSENSIDRIVKASNRDAYYCNSVYPENRYAFVDFDTKRNVNAALVIWSEGESHNSVAPQTIVWNSDDKYEMLRKKIDVAPQYAKVQNQLQDWLIANAGQLLDTIVDNDLSNLTIKHEFRYGNDMRITTTLTICVSGDFRTRVRNDVRHYLVDDKGDLLFESRSVNDAADWIIEHKGDMDADDIDGLYDALDVKWIKIPMNGKYVYHFALPVGKRTLIAMCNPKDDSSASFEYASLVSDEPVEQVIEGESMDKVFNDLSIWNHNDSGITTKVRDLFAYQDEIQSREDRHVVAGEYDSEKDEYGQNNITVTLIRK